MFLLRPTFRRALTLLRLLIPPSPTTRMVVVIAVSDCLVQFVLDTVLRSCASMYVKLEGFQINQRITHQTKWKIFEQRSNKSCTLLWGPGMGLQRITRMREDFHFRFALKRIFNSPNYISINVPHLETVKLLLIWFTNAHLNCTQLYHSSFDTALKQNSSANYRRNY